MPSMLVFCWNLCSQPHFRCLEGGKAVNVERCCFKEYGLGCTYDLILLCVSPFYTVCIKTDILCGQ